MGECEWGEEDGRFACAATGDDHDEDGESYVGFCSPTHLLEKIENI